MINIVASVNFVSLKDASRRLGDSAAHNSKQHSSHRQSSYAHLEYLGGLM